MRTHFGRAIAAAVTVLMVGIGPAQAGDFMVTLLGTASPAPRADRSGPSILIEGGDKRVMIDAGRNAPVRLWQARVPIGSIDATFITHFHSDHTSGLADLWLTGWIARPFGSRTEPFRVIGPVGVKALTDGLQMAYDGDVQIRRVDEGNPPEGIEIETTEITEDGVIFDEGGLKVTAFATNHGEQIKPNYGVVAEYDGRKVVISGDTTYDTRIADRAKGADLLIHELGAANPDMLKEDHAKRVIAHHTTPQQAGEIFAAAQPRLAAFTHLVMLSDKNHRELTLSEIVPQTRETYGGPLIVGEDLMTFDIGPAGIATYVRD